MSSWQILTYGNHSFPGARSYGTTQEWRGEDGKLHAAPDLMVEVLSPGRSNTNRDRQVQLELYSRWGVPEYWIINWQQRVMDVYRRREGELRHVKRLHAEDTLESPLLPGFSCRVERFFVGLPPRRV